MPVCAAPTTDPGGSTTDNKDKDKDNNSSGSGGSKLSKEEQQAILDEINKSMNRSASLDTLLSVYQALKTSDIDDEHSAAILVNSIRECSITPDAGQSGGGAIGLWQWDGGRRSDLQKFSEEQGDTQYTVKGYKIGGIATQVAFMLKELKGGQWGGVAPKVKYTNVDYANAQSVCKDKNFDFSKYLNIDEWFACDDPVVLSMYFTSCFERCAYGIDIAKEGGVQANDMYKLLSGADVKGNTNAELDKQLGTTMVQAGLWDETQFVSWKEATNTSLEFSDIMNLKETEIADVETWKENIEHDRGGTFLVKLGRFLCLLFGIFFEIWMMLLYLSYWFDRINNFIEFEMLKIVSFGRLTISPDESECTFRVKDVGAGEVRTVNHRTILIICITGLFFGTFVVSGGLFKVLNKFVTGVLNLF